MFININNSKSAELLQYGPADFTLEFLQRIPLQDLLAFSIQTTNHQIAFRAAWALEHILLKHPELLSTCYPSLITYYEQSKNWSVIRSFSKLMMWMLSKKNQLISLSEQEEEQVLEKTFWITEQSDCPVAVLVNAYDILYTFLPKHPWIAQELRLLVELSLEKEPSPALKSRGLRVLKKLK